MSEKVEEPSIGRTLHYTIANGDLPENRHVGECRPAHVVREFPGEYSDLAERTTSDGRKFTPISKNGFNVLVLLDGANDLPGYVGSPTLWHTSLALTAHPTHGHLHWHHAHAKTEPTHAE